MKTSTILQSLATSFEQRMDEGQQEDVDTLVIALVKSSHQQMIVESSRPISLQNRVWLGLVLTNRCSLRDKLLSQLEINFSPSCSFRDRLLPKSDSVLQNRLSLGVNFSKQTVSCLEFLWCKFPMHREDFRDTEKIPATKRFPRHRNGTEDI